MAGYAGLFRVAAVVLLLTAGATLLIPSPQATVATPPPAHQEPVRPRPRSLVTLLTMSVVLVHTAMFAGSVALPLYVTGDLHRPGRDVGLLFSAYAVVEIVVAVALVWLLPRVRLGPLILVGLILFAAYFVIAALAGSLPVLLIAQLARGTAIAIIGTAGIQLFQAVLAPASGAATALFSNATTAGSLVAGVLAGGLVQAFGSRGALAGCGALCAAATASFWAANHTHRE